MQFCYYGLRHKIAVRKGPSFFTFLVFTLFTFGCTSVETETIIPASPEEIWSVLIDADGYKEWNSLQIPIEGKIKDGAKIKYHYFQPEKEPIEIEFKVVKFERYKELNKSGGIWGYFSFVHHWFLEPVPEGIRVIQHKDLSGIGVFFWDHNQLKSSYSDESEALK